MITVKEKIKAKTDFMFKCLLPALKEHGCHFCCGNIEEILSVDENHVFYKCKCRKPVMVELGLKKPLKQGAEQ